MLIVLVGGPGNGQHREVPVGLDRYRVPVRVDFIREAIDDVFLLGCGIMPDYTTQATIAEYRRTSRTLEGAVVFEWRPPSTATDHALDRDFLASCGIGDRDPLRPSLPLE